MVFPLHGEGTCGGTSAVWLVSRSVVAPPDQFVLAKGRRMNLNPRLAPAGRAMVPRQTLPVFQASLTALSGAFAPSSGCGPIRQTSLPKPTSLVRLSSTSLSTGLACTATPRQRTARRLETGGRILSRE